MHVYFPLPGNKDVQSILSLKTLSIMETRSTLLFVASTPHPVK